LRPWRNCKTGKVGERKLLGRARSPRTKKTAVKRGENWGKELPLLEKKGEGEGKKKVFTRVHKPTLKKKKGIARTAG